MNYHCKCWPQTLGCPYRIFGPTIEMNHPIDRCSILNRRKEWERQGCQDSASSMSSPKMLVRFADIGRLGIISGSAKEKAIAFSLAEVIGELLVQCKTRQSSRKGSARKVFQFSRWPLPHFRTS